jgi:hypothetical protein
MHSKSNEKSQIHERIKVVKKSYSLEKSERQRVIKSESLRRSLNVKKFKISQNHKITES